MGTLYLAFLGSLFSILPADSRAPAAGTGERVTIVTFQPAVDPDIKARELCLLHGCNLVHVYRILPGMAVSGGNLAAIARTNGVSAVESDLAVTLQEDAPNLIGAPGEAPLAVLGGRLDVNRLLVERSWKYSPEAEVATETRPETSGLLASLTQRQPDRAYWSFEILNSEGLGRLTDLLAALDRLAALRFAVGAIYIPLRLQGPPPVILCEMIDKVLRRGLLVITDVDAACWHP